MTELAALMGITVAIAIGAASPGPSFVMVARMAVAASRTSALFAALGMGCGGLIFAGLALVGLHGLLVAVPTLYLVLKIAGGLYLAYLGIRIWRGATAPLADISTNTGSAGDSRLRSFLLGMTTQLSNPKTAIVYASVFAAFLPRESSIVFGVSVVAIVFALEAGWYALVALALSAQRPRRTYLHFKTWIDRAAGGVMVALGLRLATSARL